MNPIAQGISDFFANLINNVVNSLNTNLGPLVALIGNTPLQLTTGNPIINGAWITMVGIADAFLGLYVIIKLIQMMHGEATGTIHMPVGQFVPKVILTIILIHASSFLGTQLILIINALCAVVNVNVQDLIRQANNGQPVTAQQNVTFFAILTLISLFSLIRVVFQAIKRVIFFNVLYVLSGPAFLMSLDVQTAPWFQFWLRTYLVTILTQFLQFLTLDLGIQFLLATNQTGFIGFVLAIALLNLTAEIPSLLSRFASSAGASAPGLGEIARGAITAAALFI